MHRALIATILATLCLSGTAAWGYRDYFTSEQKQQLAKVQTVLVEAIALTDKGQTDASAIRDAVIAPLKSMESAPA